MPRESMFLFHGTIDPVCIAAEANGMPDHGVQDQSKLTLGYFLDGFAHGRQVASIRNLAKRAANHGSGGWLKAPKPIEVLRKPAGIGVVSSAPRESGPLETRRGHYLTNDACQVPEIPAGRGNRLSLGASCCGRRP